LSVYLFTDSLAHRPGFNTAKLPDTNKLNVYRGTGYPCEMVVLIRLLMYGCTNF